MEKPIQPQFKIRVFVGSNIKDIETLRKSKAIASSSGGYIDIEPCVALPVVYEEQASLLNTMSFTVDKNADILLYYFHIGQAIALYGGYYADNQSKMFHVFSGTVTRIRTQFADNGRVSFKVECMNYGYTKLGKDFKNFVYPDMGSSRNFAKSDSLLLEDIIKGIAKENNVELGDIMLPAKANRIKFDNKNIKYQKNMSDWKFLSLLAHDFGCNLWISSEDGVDKLNFVESDKVASRQSTDISFLYPLYGVIKEPIESEMQRFDNPAYNRPRILRSVTVDEDISQAYAVSRASMYFDKTTGEYKEAISKIETKDGKNTITFYEFDEERVAYVHEHFPKIADKIRENGPTSMPWGTPDNPENASYYYKQKKVYDEETAVFDGAFFGITLTATCNQDLNIHSQRTYKVRGILRYHSKNTETSFFLRGLKHTWDKNGTWTELDFIR